MGKILNRLEEMIENYLEKHKGERPGLVSLVFTAGLLLMVASLVAGWMGLAVPIDLAAYGVLLAGASVVLLALIAAVALVVVIVICIIDHFVGGSEDDAGDCIKVEGETVFKGKGQVTICVDGTVVYTFEKPLGATKE